MKSRKQHKRIPKELMAGADYQLQLWAINTSYNAGTGYPSSSAEQRERIGGVFQPVEKCLGEDEIKTINTMSHMLKHEPSRHKVACLEYRERHHIMGRISANKGWWNAGRTKFFSCKRATAAAYSAYVRDYYGIGRTEYYEELSKVKRDVAHFVLNSA